jgi:DNA-binding beta-propeller fold protein YncE
MRAALLAGSVVVGCVAAGAAALSAQGAAARATAATPQLQAEPFWPKPLPNNWILGQVSGVAVDKRDHVWIVQRPRSLSDRELGAQQNPPWSKCCRAAPPVIVFDQDGNVVRAWGGPGAGYEWPESEHGIFVDGDDAVWLAGNGNKDSQLLKFTLEGKFLLQIGRSGQSKGSNDTANLGSPADVNVDVAGREVYVADGYRNRRIIVFDSETGAYKRHWGAYGKPPSDAATPPYDPARPPSAQFGQPVHCVRLAADGLIYVCDRTNNRVQVFRKDGTFVSEAFFEKDTRLNGSVSEVAFSADRAQSLMFMVDGVNNEMRIVDRATNAVVGRVGRPGRFAGQFHVVHNVAVDSRGNVYTTEVNTGQRVQKFRPVAAQK